jgi:hypothetical protein
MKSKIALVVLVEYNAFAVDQEKKTRGAYRRAPER